MSILLLALAAAAAPFTVAETGQGFPTLAAAVDSVRDGTATILIAPGTYHQCVVQAAGRITYKAVQPGTAIFERTVCEDKAAFVLRGRGSAVDGVVFRKFRVRDGNGAGIRIEMGDLTVTRSTFLDSQEGILGGGHPSVRNITIDRSSFAGLGQCDESPNCAHSVYLSVDGLVTITHSRFERGTGGHYVKLRARRVAITGNSFDDSAGARTNYMIDLSEGGTGMIAQNMFVQGPAKENRSGLIVVAAEARTYPSDGLRVEGNTASLAPGAPANPAFVADLSGGRITVANNRLTGMRAFEKR
ncbi:right-handed parallel beta-helix repeat-containing protein [Sphingomonas pituitosa]|uniref:right-handed parallel beta-helix repeat-containing protein n=1 Tax=Sphingomonas pituitosa TaxID=99597 RepID=UPI00083728CE|nr:right-handed parallel beta-helix repeat-containing protein [Sphingomonas pituitosa]